MTRRYLPLILLTMLAGALLAVGCGGSDDDSGSSSSSSGDSAATSESTDLPDGTIGIELGEFFVRPSSESVAAGEVTFQVENVGSTTHELVIYRTDEKPDALKQDGGVAQLDSAKVIDETDDLASGDDAELTVDLEPGTYLLLCNLPGHYASGQVVAFTVT